MDKYEGLEPGFRLSEIVTKKRVYIVNHKELETDVKKSETMKINMWRPYYYDSFNRVGNCTVLSLNESVDALIKVIRGEKHMVSSKATSFKLHSYASLRIFWRFENIDDCTGKLLTAKSKAFYLYHEGKIMILEKANADLLMRFASDSIQKRIPVLPSEDEPVIRDMNEEAFWEKLITSIKLEKPKFILNNIDF